MMNGCFIFKNWGDSEAHVEIDGHTLKHGNGCRIGKIPTLEGCDLVLWIEKESTTPIRIAVSHRENAL
jgi:hypothetical protein